MFAAFFRCNRRVDLKLAFVLLLFSLLGGWGCEGKTDVAWRGTVADLEKFPQNLNAFVKPETADKPLISASGQEAAAERYLYRFYKPWEQKKSGFSKKSMASSTNGYAGKGSWTRNGERIDPGLWTRAVDNANVKAFPGVGWKGILVENAFLRGLPVSTPFYKNPELAGEGYPFDYLQYSTLWIGTPVYVSHISRDEEWLFCETAQASGWVLSRSVSPVNERFMDFWRTQALGAVVKDKLPLEAGRGNAGFASANDLRIGTLLPRQGGNFLVPVAQGVATGWQPVALPPGAAREFPVPLTPANVAAVGNEMMGEPYGWGGLDYLRDCSAMIRDLFTPFGLWFPRNSSSQIQIGQVRDLSFLRPADKEGMLRDFGEPFVTLVGLPGHIMLYVGQYEGRAAVFHDVWGSRTVLSDGKAGRLIIGKVVVSSLEPGIEHPQVVKEETLLNRADKMSIITVWD